MGFDLRRLDIYRKVPKDLTQPTVTGAVISICCCAFMTFLFFSEFFHFISPEVVSELFVDNPGNSDEKIPVQINITLPRLACEYVGIDIQDDLGRHDVGFIENTLKTPWNKGRGCIFESRFHINRVPGNFHVSTHSADKQPDNADMAHYVTSLTFGEVLDNKNLPGNFNPLARRDRSQADPAESHDYTMKIVPTIYEDSAGKTLVSYQYTYAYSNYVSFSLGGRSPAAIWFRYDLNPITVKYHERRQPIYAFLTSVCAIIGGTFTVAGIIDSFVFTASEIFKKFEIGKLS
ncbi:endoplasmic reticulum-Golgi intermediate compartment protein 1 [Daphnia magna]|uniref:Uncharacterized protein n=2 Tax=Daphnia magna TaxID=35525 RepID=A0A0P5S341_9CRUS|nr:endoplasmic reticulum-Golgi intermediate compartment protein 1 [Daphnia magna]KAK4026654.1 hypothetical protein OUZ56_015681 [Daphnia magna]KZS16720.1 Uncharacterized protein APZ42_017336 [Daphnia magna]